MTWLFCELAERSDPAAAAAVCVIARKTLTVVGEDYWTWHIDTRGRRLLDVTHWHSWERIIGRDTCASFVGAFAKLSSSCPFVCPSAWNNSAHTGRSLMKFDLWGFFWKSVGKIQISLKSDKNNVYFTWRPMHICGNISLNSSEIEKCFRQNL
jgi:hypothetical protein